MECIVRQKCGKTHTLLLYHTVISCNTFWINSLCKEYQKGEINVTLANQFPSYKSYNVNACSGVTKFPRSCHSWFTFIPSFFYLQSWDYYYFNWAYWRRFYTFLSFRISAIWDYPIIGIGTYYMYIPSEPCCCLSWTYVGFVGTGKINGKTGLWSVLRFF